MKKCCQLTCCQRSTIWIIFLKEDSFSIYGIACKIEWFCSFFRISLTRIKSPAVSLTKCHRHKNRYTNLINIFRYLCKFSPQIHSLLIRTHQYTFCFMFNVKFLHHFHHKSCFFIHTDRGFSMAIPPTKLRWPKSVFTKIDTGCCREELSTAFNRQQISFYVFYFQ